RRLVLLEVGYVLAHPLLLTSVPPDVLLALRPRLPLRVGRRAVVEDPPVQRPRPGPLGSDPALLLARVLARRLVLLVPVDAAVDPAAGRGRAVGLQVRVGSERTPVGADAV